MKNDWLGIYGGKESLLACEYEELEQKWGKKFDIPIYNLADDNSINLLCEDIIYRLSMHIPLHRETNSAPNGITLSACSGSLSAPNGKSF